MNTYNAATARLPVVSEELIKDEKTGDVKVIWVERLVTNPQAALKALELIGKNIAVQHFRGSLK